MKKPSLYNQVRSILTKKDFDILKKHKAVILFGRNYLKNRRSANSSTNSLIPIVSNNTIPMYLSFSWMASKEGYWKWHHMQILSEKKSSRHQFFININNNKRSSLFTYSSHGRYFKRTKKAA